MSSRGASVPLPRSAPARYWCSSIWALNETSLIIPTPGSMWNTLVDVLAHLLAGRSSGTPSSAAITVGGQPGAEVLHVVERRPRPALRVEAAPRRARGCGPRAAATRRGVNARDTSARSRVWSGGSMKMIEPPAHRRGSP